MKVSTRKGTPIDVVLLPVVLIIFAIAGYVAIQGIFDFNNEARADLSAPAQAILDQQVNSVGVIDNLFLFFMVGFGLIILAGALLLKAHPAFVIIGILIVIFGVVISAPISNTFEQFSNDSTYSANTTSNTPKIGYVMSNLPKIILMFGLMLCIVLWIGGSAL